MKQKLLFLLVLLLTATTGAWATDGIECSASDIGKVLCTDGSIYATVSDATAASKTAAAVIVYVDETNKKGLAIALADEGTMNWSTAKSTCEGKTAISGVKWCLPSQNQWEQMFQANGGNTTSYTGLNTTITNAGGTNLQKDNTYWSSSETNPGVSACTVNLIYDIVGWGNGSEDNVDVRVRACLAFAPPSYAVTLAEGTEDAKNWTIPAEAAAGTAVTATYSGERKVKSVKAVKKNTAYAANEYNYASWNYTLKKVEFTKQTAASVTAVTNSDTDVTWGDGWYTVSGNVTINGKVTLGSNTSLILQDGATLTINGQLNAASYDLDIYGQMEGTGKLNVTCNDNAIKGPSNMTIHIHGGEITATATGDSHHGLYFGYIEMYSGKLTATAADYHAIKFESWGFRVYGGEVEATSNATSGGYNGIQSDGSLMVYGGKVKGTGSEYGGGIGFNCKVQSATSNIKFYFHTDGATWGDGDKYEDETLAPGYRYAKAE